MRQIHFLLTKGLMQKEDIIIVNIYTPSNTFSKYTNQKCTEFKGDIDNFTVTVSDFKTPL